MNKNIIVKKTDNKGKGVFALKNFKKNEFILHIDGKIIETNKPSSFSKKIQDHWFPFDKRGIKKKYVLPKSPWKYLNHSCNPNAGIRNNRDIIAIKAIKKGEEIVFDYAMNNIDNWKMRCSCGSKNCRKIISTFDGLDNKTKKKYINYVIDCIKEKYFNLIHKKKKKTKMKIIIIHGSNGNPDEHWFKWLGKQLDIEVHIPQFPIKHEQNLGNWMKIIEKIGVDKNTILVGHSVACSFILSVLEKYKAKAAFLVGGFIGKLNISYDELNKTFAEKKFNWGNIKKNCKIFFIYNSDNDPYVPLKKGEELAKKLKVKLKLIKNAGHFRIKDGYSKFPLLLEDVKSIK